MSLLLLDFDGVTHPMCTGSLFCRTPLLWKILRACPHVEVVFSTAWRETYPFDTLIGLATEGGGEDVVHRFVGMTPELNYVDHEYPREAECRAWLAENNQGQRPWLAIDDIAEWFAPRPNPNFYWVNPGTGLTDEDVRAIIQILSRISP